MHWNVRVMTISLVVWTATGCSGAGNAFQGTLTNVCSQLAMLAPQLIMPLTGATGVADDLASIKVDTGGTGYALRTANGGVQQLGVAVLQAQNVYALALPTLQAHMPYIVTYTTGAMGSGICATASTIRTVGTFATL